MYNNMENDTLEKLLKNLVKQNAELTKKISLTDNKTKLIRQKNDMLRNITNVVVELRGRCENGL